MPSDLGPDPVHAPDLAVRPATPEVAEALATVYLDARAAAYPAIPPTVHPPDDVRRWWRSRLEAGAGEAVDVWLAQRDQEVVGLLLVERDWLHSLYVAPGLTGQGIGTVLLDVAKALRPTGLGLWVFESNKAARRFYRRHGFAEVRRTDGSDNEERVPDVAMAWPDPGSIDELRRRVDDVDDRLAGLLGERARLTARIQRLKEVPGHAGRDQQREAHIVARMARLAPALGPERLARVMDAVITESLDAAEQRPEDAPGEGAGEGAGEGTEAGAGEAADNDPR